MATQRLIALGRVAGVYGVAGWVKVYSYTRPRENIFGYSPWRLGREHRPYALEGGRAQGRGLIAKLAGCDDRDRARELVGAEIAVAREQLPPPGEDEYYWADLVGLRVVTEEGQVLGVVDYLMETGSNDVLVVRGDRERLIPFILEQVVVAVDLMAGEIRVRWDPDF